MEISAYGGIDTQYGAVLFRVAGCQVRQDSPWAWMWGDYVDPANGRVSPADRILHVKLTEVQPAPGWEPQ